MSWSVAARTHRVQILTQPYIRNEAALQNTKEGPGDEK